MVDHEQLLDLVAVKDLARAASSVVPTGTVMRFSLVMMSAIGRCVDLRKRRSRLVRMPNQAAFLLPSSVMGTPRCVISSSGRALP